MDMPWHYVVHLADQVPVPLRERLTPQWALPERISTATALLLYDMLASPSNNTAGPGPQHLPPLPSPPLPLRVTTRGAAPELNLKPLWSCMRSRGMHEGHRVWEAARSMLASSFGRRLGRGIGVWRRLARTPALPRLLRVRVRGRGRVGCLRRALRRLTQCRRGAGLPRALADGEPMSWLRGLGPSPTAPSDQAGCSPRVSK